MIVIVGRLNIKRLHQLLLCPYQHSHHNHHTPYQHPESAHIQLSKISKHFHKVNLNLYMQSSDGCYTYNCFLENIKLNWIDFSSSCCGWFNSNVASSTQSSNPHWSRSTHNCTSCWKCILQTTSVCSTNGTSIGWSVGSRKFLFLTRIGIGLSRGS